MGIIGFLVFMFLGFAGMEMVSYLVHRFIFHGLLWDIHKTHHKARHRVFELNDLFSVFFAGISIGLIYIGSADPINSVLFALGSGIAIYGVLYFIVHDLFAHKRFLSFKSDSKIMRIVRRAHQRHHQSVEKEGQEPYGLFLFPYDEYSE